MRFFSNEVGNVNSGIIEIQSFGARRYDLFTMFAWGTWAGATLKLQISLDQSVWFDVPLATFTGDGVLNIQFRAPFARANISGGAGHSLSAELR